MGSSVSWPSCWTHKNCQNVGRSSDTHYSSYKKCWNAKGTWRLESIQNLNFSLGVQIIKAQLCSNFDQWSKMTLSFSYLLPRFLKKAIEIANFEWSISIFCVKNQLNSSTYDFCLKTINLGEQFYYWLFIGHNFLLDP